MESRASPPGCPMSSFSKPASSKNVHGVKLQTREPGLLCPQRTADQSGEAQLHVTVKLVESIEAVLRDIRSLANIAVIEVAEHCFAFDVDAGVSDLPVPFLLQSADSPFGPVSAPLIRVAGGVAGLLERLRRAVSRSRE